MQESSIIAIISLSVTATAAIVFFYIKAFIYTRQQIVQKASEGIHYLREHSLLINKNISLYEQEGANILKNNINRAVSLTEPQSFVNFVVFQYKDGELKTRWYFKVFFVKKYRIAFNNVRRFHGGDLLEDVIAIPFSGHSSYQNNNKLISLRYEVIDRIEEKISLIREGVYK